MPSGEIQQKVRLDFSDPQGGKGLATAKQPQLRTIPEYI